MQSTSTNALSAFLRICSPLITLNSNVIVSSMRVSPAPTLGHDLLAAIYQALSYWRSYHERSCDYVSSLPRKGSGQAGALHAQGIKLQSVEASEITIAANQYIVDHPEVMALAAERYQDFVKRAVHLEPDLPRRNSDSLD
jgi:hypothetical protein